MPSHQGLGPDDRDGLEDRWKPSIQLDQEQAISVHLPGFLTVTTSENFPLIQGSYTYVFCSKAVLGLCA